MTVWNALTDDGWVEQHPGVRFALRILGRLVIGYLVVATGSFEHSALTSVVAAAGIAAVLATVVTPWLPRVWMTLLIYAVMALSGALLNAEPGWVGWLLLGLATFALLGEPTMPQRPAIAITVLSGLITVGVGAYEQHSLTSVVSDAAAAIALAAAGYSRRVNRLRRNSERELVQRSRELEQRSLQLIEQTEKTRAETARAAALEERSRIAGDLHDLLAHALGGLVVQLDATEAMLASGADPDDVAARLRTSRQLAVDGLRDARAAVRELRVDESATGRTDDPVDAVSAVIGGPVGIQLGARLDVVGEPFGAPAPVAQAFAAVSREALTNINKHAPGARVSASLIFEAGSIRLEVINGVGAGADPQLAGSGSGFGLQTMTKRMTEIGGTLTAGPSGNGRWTVTAAWCADGHEPGDHRDDGGEEGRAA